MNRDKLFGLKNPDVLSFGTDLFQRIILQRQKLSPAPIPLEGASHPSFPGLSTLHRGSGQLEFKKPSAILGPIELGYGRYRMAYAVYSFLAEKKASVYIHDPMAIESGESRSIQEMEAVFNSLNRLSSDMGGPLEMVWGWMTSQGNLNSLYLSTKIAEKYKNLAQSLPSELTYVSTYSLNGQIAYEAGLRNILNLVPDNHAQYHQLVPGAMNLLQSPSLYMKFVEMGIPKENLKVVGHWASKPVLRNLEKECKARIQRAEDRTKRRFLLPLGGAGIRSKFLSELLKLSVPHLRNDEFAYFINTGNHAHFFQDTVRLLEKEKIPYNKVTDRAQFLEFLKKNSLDKKSSEDLKPVTLFYSPDFLEGLVTTDELIPKVDVLVCRPSELGFYPVPKIFIRRIADYEKNTAARSLELGDGTVECREPQYAMDLIRMFRTQADLLIRMNESILLNHKEKLYSGAEKAAELALNFPY